MKKSPYIVLNPVSQCGDFTVYKRKPKPIGSTLYTVYRGQVCVNDFSRLAAAKKWAIHQWEISKSQMAK